MPEFLSRYQETCARTFHLKTWNEGPIELWIAQREVTDGFIQHAEMLVFIQ